MFIELRKMLSEFSQNIPSYLVQTIQEAVTIAEINNEIKVITPLSQLITLLYSKFDSNQAIKLYMTDQETRGSSTRKCFYPMTLYDDLYPEDKLEYVCPNPPPFPPSLIETTENNYYQVYESREYISSNNLMSSNQEPRMGCDSKQNLSLFTLERQFAS